MHLRLPRFLRFLFRREWLLFMGVVAFVLLGAGVYWLTRPTQLKVAVGPPDSPEVRLVEAYAKALVEQRAGIRLNLVRVDDLKSSAESLQRGGVDLAVVRPDVLLPVNGLSMAILREEALIIAAPQASKIDDVGALEKKRIGLVIRHEADPRFLEAVLAHYGLKASDVTVIPLKEADIPAALAKKKIDAVAFVATATGSAAQELIRAIEKGTGGKMSVVSVGQAETLAERNPALTSMEIGEGALGGRPKQPAEEVKTIGVSYRLMARANLSRITVSEATQYLFQMRSRLALATPAANQMKALDTDTATGAALPIHPGAIDYFAREQHTLMDRYGDFLWLALFSMGGVSSAVAWFFQQFARRRRELIDVLLDRLLKILSSAREATTVAQLNDLTAELDRLVSLAVKYARNRTTNARSMSALILGIDSARAALVDRRRDILDEASGTAETSIPKPMPSLAKTAQASRRN
jgi:TRAP transporter TAXI family solute receptor